jgi:hypothetical protein
MPSTPPPDVTIDAPPDAPSVEVQEAHIGGIRGSRVDASEDAIGHLVADEVHLEQGAVGLLRAQQVGITQGVVGALAAEHVEARESFAFLVIARRLSGDVTVLLDWRSVAALVGTLLVLGRLLRGRG